MIAERVAHAVGNQKTGDRLFLPLIQFPDGGARIVLERTRPPTQVTTGGVLVRLGPKTQQVGYPACPWNIQKPDL